MRKLLNIMAIIGFTACAVVGFAPSAQAAAENSPGQICKQLKGELEAFVSGTVGHPVSVSNGTCVNLLTGLIHGNGAVKPGFCKLLADLEVIPQNQVGQCVANVEDDELPVGPTNWSVAVFAALLSVWGLFQFARWRKGSACAA